MNAKYRFLFIEDQVDDALLLTRRLKSAGFDFDGNGSTPNQI